MAVGENNKILAIGNPLHTSGRFYQNFTRANGWKRVTINSLQHPNVTGLGKPIPGCVTAVAVDALVADWCEEEGVQVFGRSGVFGCSGAPAFPERLNTQHLNT